MNDSDLDSKLKGVPLPERPEDYWENFPAQVRWQLRRTRPEPRLHESWRPRLVWKMSASLACLILGLLVLSQPLKAASSAISHKEQFVRQQLTAIPGHLQVLMADEHGLHYLVADKE